MTKFETNFWKRVNKRGSKGCWLWLGCKTRAGYGHMIRNNHIRKFPHRISYELTGKIIPEGYTIDHICRNRLCVNPNHLRAVTLRENVLAGNTIAAFNAAKTHCINGHEFTLENTALSNNGRNRKCKECNNIRQRAFQKIYRAKNRKTDRVMSDTTRELHKQCALNYWKSKSIT